MSEWKLVPVDPTLEMLVNAFKECGGIGVGSCGEASPIDGDDMRSVYAAMLDAAPLPPCDTLTAEEARNKQHWKGMDGACAFHLIERHADGWNDVGLMMQAWLDANKGTP